MPGTKAISSSWATTYLPSGTPAHGLPSAGDRGNPYNWVTYGSGTNGANTNMYRQVTDDPMFSSHPSPFGAPVGSMCGSSIGSILTNCEYWIQFDWSNISTDVYEITAMDCYAHLSGVPVTQTPSLQISLYDELGGGFPDRGYGTLISQTELYDCNTNGKSITAHYNYKFPLPAFTMDYATAQASAVVLHADGGGTNPPPEDDYPYEVP